MIALFNQLLNYLYHAVYEGHTYGPPKQMNGHFVQQCIVCDKIKNVSKAPACYGSNPSPQTQAENGCRDCPWIYSCFYIRKT